MDSSREVLHIQRIEYIKSRPLACQGILKNFYQCSNFYEYEKEQSSCEAKEKCLEKFNYVECLEENRAKCFENWILNKEELDG